MVTFAPRSEVPVTRIDVADAIAAFKSRLPVISITPRVRVPPMMPLNWAVPLPMLKVRLRDVASLSIVEPKVTLLAVVVRVLVPPLNVTASV